MSFIDGYSRFASITLLKVKSDTAVALDLHLATMPEKLCTRVLHSDQGGEYTGKEMQEVLRKWGIRPLTSPAYTPKYNGVAERFNQTMGNMVQCLLINMNLQRDMWGEAIHMVVMLYNHTPSVGNGGKTPYKLYYGEKPNLAHVHQFSLKSYRMV
jgi:transposase InsO family protein